MSNNISDKDKKDWKKFISSNEKLPDKDYNQKNKVRLNKKLIDLHGYTLKEANIAIEKFILQSYKQNIKKLIVVTGKGLHSYKENDPYVSKDMSILKYSVPEFINNNNKLMSLIVEMKDAKIEDGGSGAFYIYLKKNKKITF